MVRRLGLTVAMAGLWVMLAGMLVPAAYAYQHATPPISDPAYDAPFTTMVDTLPQTTGGGSIIPPSVGSDLMAAGEAAGRWPSFTQIAGAIALVPAAFDAGWNVGRVIDTKLLHLQDPNCIIFGCRPSPDGSNFGAVSIYSTVVPINQGTPECRSGCHVFATGNYWEACEGTASGSCTVTLPGPNNYDGKAWIKCPTCATNQPRIVGDAAWNALVGEGWIPYVMDNVAPAGDCGTPISASLVTECDGLYKPDSSVTPALMAGATPTTGTCTTPAFAKCFSTTMPTSSCGGTNQNACAPNAQMPAAAKAAAVGALSTVDQGWVNCYLAPSDYSCPDTPGGGTTGAPTADFTILKPQSGETFDQYQARLRNEGWLGNIVQEDDTGFNPLSASPYPSGSPALQLNPNVVTQVGYASGTLPLAYPLWNGTTGQSQTWPNPPKVVNKATTSIYVATVPGGYTPPGGGTNPPGTGSTPPTNPVPPGGGGGCSCPPIDFTPIESLNVGSKFPFGAFTYLTGIFSSVSLGSSPISFNLDLFGTPKTVTLSSSEWESTYRPIMFPILEFIMTVSAIWYFAARFMGASSDDG